MSIDYDLVCHKHKEKVLLCSDGFSGPLPQGSKELASFAIKHKDCSLHIIDESCEYCEDYKDWG